MVKDSLKVSKKRNSYLYLCIMKKNKYNTY